MKITTEQPDKGVFVFRYNIPKKSVGRIMRVLNCSDIHIDSKDCDRELLKKHLDECDYVKIYGDLFDLMQGKHDKRRSNSDMKDKYLRTNYIDRVVMDAVEFFKPYAKKLLFVGLGNHETSVISNAGTNPISAFCMMMRMEGSSVIEGTYQGFIIDHIEYGRNPQWFSIKTAFHHGHGGAPQKTEGTLEIEGDKAKFPNVDIVVKGHNHFKWHNPGQTRFWLTNKGTVEKKVQHHIRLGTYKATNFTEGWAVEKGFKPNTTGSYFIDYRFVIGSDGKSHKMLFDVVSAD
jgi:predicted phosphodiesterase